jgi:hypothetical protein
MGFLEIDVVKLPPQDRRLQAVHLDLPITGRQSSPYSFELAGWVVPADVPVGAVELRCDGVTVHRGAAGKRRPDVVAHLRDAGGWTPDALQAAEMSGFHEGVNVVGLPEVFELQVDVVFQDGSRAALAVLNGRRGPLRIERQPALRPIMVMHVARSGSTFLMRLLSRHPAIAVLPRHPLEACMASYAARLFSTLATPCPAPGNREVGMMAETSGLVGPLPFCCEAEAPGAQNWMRDGHVRRIAEFAVGAMDDFYRETVRGLGREGCVFFAEKFFARTGLACVLAELCPGAKEVFLVRDFRDVLCSRLPGIPAERRKPLEEKLGWVARDAHRLVERWRRVAGKAVLVRYEDLILKPEAALAELFKQLGLDHSSETVRRILAENSDDEECRSMHGSSPDPVQSVGRWKRDLSPERQAFFTSELAVPLREFGYPVDNAG